ncbi:cellulase family glycosylhydrolase [Streptomyces sp. MAR4 CNX-425]|uniref:cellulase family glycosylhydrolase n=1 Tax=Streptomyces sp. MAR4 CNX-425 TaxID=3406343 RepID=UPI003B504509
MSARRTRSRTAPARALLAALLGLAAAVAGFGPGAQAAPAAAAVGLHTEGGRLVEGNGSDFVLRGVNHPHAWYTGELDSLREIKQLGANSVRVVLSSGDRWTRNDVADVDNVVSTCKANRLICVLEVHDTTGYGEEAAAVSLDRAADYWISVRDALVGQEDYVIVNLGNEPHGNQGYERWTADTQGAIARLRDAGFQHTLMVDAPNWGQDWTGTMRTNARAVADSDPQDDVLFSIHMYGVYDTAAEIEDYLTAFTSAGLPIAVGEFGHDHSDGNPDEDAILRVTRELGLGYLGWSYSGNGGGVEYLDMVTDFDPAALTDWGRRIFHGENGIVATAKEATVYGGGTGDTEAPTAPGAPAVTGVTHDSATLSWPAAADNVAVTGYDVYAVTGTAEDRVAGTTGTSVTVTGLDPDTAYTFAVRARDAAGNVSPRSATVTATTGSGPAPADGCTPEFRVVNSWPGGFQAEVTVANTGATPIDGWELTWTFAGGHTVTHAWGGSVGQSGTAVTVTPAAYTREIPAGGSVTVGMTGTGGSTLSAPDDLVCGTG